MNAKKLSEIFEQARIEVQRNRRQPGEVSAEICAKHGLNWMFVAPTVLTFKR